MDNNNAKEGTIFLVEDYKPCCVCEKPTNRVDYCYEARICSRECEDVLDKEWMKQENCEEKKC